MPDFDTESSDAETFDTERPQDLARHFGVVFLLGVVVGVLVGVAGTILVIGSVLFGP